MQNKKRQQDKEKKEMRERRQQKLEKEMQIKANIQAVKMDYKEKCKEINEKFDKMDEKVHEARQKKVIETTKHRELEQLRLSDIH